MIWIALHSFVVAVVVCSDSFHKLTKEQRNTQQYISGSSSMGNTTVDKSSKNDAMMDQSPPKTTTKDFAVGDLKQYQKDNSSFGPDKTGTWVTSIDQDGWVLSHNSLRGELDEVSAACAAILSTKNNKTDTLLAAWKLQCLQTVWKYHADHVVLHQKAEEEVMQPFLETRVKYPKQVSTIASRL